MPTSSKMNSSLLRMLSKCPITLIVSRKWIVYSCKLLQSCACFYPLYSVYMCLMTHAPSFYILRKNMNNMINRLFINIWIQFFTVILRKTFNNSRIKMRLKTKTNNYIFINYRKPVAQLHSFSWSYFSLRTVSCLSSFVFKLTIKPCRHFSSFPNHDHETSTNLHNVKRWKIKKKTDQAE